MSWDESKFIGENNAANGVDTSAVVANADGTVLERLEDINVKLGGGAAALRTTFSDSQAVEENAVQFFNIGVFDIDAGAIASGSIDITSISAVMQKSTGGGAFATGTIAQPTFSKANGSVYCAYQFIAADWVTGDMYKLVVSGITATIHGTTAYIPAGVWSNVVLETADIDSAVDGLVITCASIQTDVGTAISDIGTVAGVVGTIHDTDLPNIKTDTGLILLATEYLTATADTGTVYPAKVLDNSILSILMTKQSGGDTSDFDNSTDSLEAQSDKIGAFTGDGGAAQDDSVKSSLDLAHTDLDAIIAKLATGVGQVQVVQATESLNQAASAYDLLTGTTQAVLLEGLSVKMPAEAAGGALTSISIQTDNATPGVIISSTLGAVANLTSEAELSWTGFMLINVGTKIQLTIAGGAHGSAYVATVTAKYLAVVAGGTLAA
ncbi:MAG: hypothetical protein WC455_16475 [Dehalococcoidia bacterium]|jgi:hypothetical protein